MKRLSALPLVLLLACGGAVTDPSLEGFDHDPRPVAGDWVTEVRDASGNPSTLSAELVPAGGVFLGSFEFVFTGRQWRVFFQEGEWDGIRVRFTTHENVDEGPPWEVDWIATYHPATESQPARLLLTSTLFFFAIEYVRP